MYKMIKTEVVHILSSDINSVLKSSKLLIYFHKKNLILNIF